MGCSGVRGDFDRLPVSGSTSCALATSTTNVSSNARSANLVGSMDESMTVCGGVGRGGEGGVRFQESNQLEWE